MSEQAKKENPPLLRSIVWPFAREGKRPVQLFAAGILAVGATALSHLATPWFIANLIDAAPKGDMAGVRSAVIGLFATAALSSAGGATRMLAARRLAELFKAHLRGRLMTQVLRLRFSDLEGTANRRLNSVFIDDVPAISRLAQPIALDLVLSLIQIVGALGILIVRFPSFAWVVLLVVPLNVVIGIWQWPLTKIRARDQLQTKTAVDSITLQILEGVRDLKALSANKPIADLLKTLISNDLRAKWRAEIVQSVDNGRYMLTWLLMCAVYFIGALAVARGQLSIGSLTAFVWYVGFLDSPISRLWNTMTGWQTMQASAHRYMDVMKLESETEGHLALSHVELPTVDFRNVTFSYGDAAAPTLAGLDLRFEAGQQVAIVGTSGAGKTTLVSLIVRLFDPESGTIAINGVDIRDYTLNSLRGYVAVVPQEPFIFDGTIRHNITLGMERYSDTDIRNAATVADADGFIAELPDGYDTVLGVRGARLSGGQKRRIAIARAIIRQPRILIFDEVTGSLDSITEAAVLGGIAQSCPGCTTITVSHRLSSTSHADLIVVLDKGRVIGTGTHRSLLASCAPYRALARLQVIGQKIFEQSDDSATLARDFASTFSVEPRAFTAESSPRR